MANLPSTITTTAQGVFASAGKESDEHIFYAPSPQGDLQGRPALRVAHELTKTGIRKTLASLDVPEYNSTTGEYVGSARVNVTITRRNAADTADVLDVVESMKEVLATTDVDDALVEAAL
jgi:hypothetical protein